MYKRDETFEWASGRLDSIVGPWMKGSIVIKQKTGLSRVASDHDTSRVAVREGDPLQEIVKILAQQTTLLAATLTRAGPLDATSTQLSSSATKSPTGTLSESQTARILGWYGLSWTEQEKIPPLWH